MGSLLGKNTPVYALCMLALCMAGCSAIRQSDDAADILDRKLAASVVYLHGNKKPEQLNRLIQPGTVVVWLNKCDQHVRIVFPEQRATIACLNPVSFYLDETGIFESKVLPPGAVASLCFIQPGLYAYLVESTADTPGDQAEKLQLKGTIVVQ